MDSEAQWGDQDKQINEEHFLTACVCVFLSPYEHFLCFSSVLCTSKYWFRLNSLSPALSTGTRHCLRFTWHRFIDVGMHLPYNHGVRVFVRCFYSIINSLMFSCWFLSCFLCFHRIKNITICEGFFSFHLVRESKYSLSMHYKMCWGFLLSWSIFTTGIKQLCTDRNSKSPTMVYNPIISVSLKGVWWNGQTLENGLKLNNLRWELDFWINSLPLRHRIIGDRLIGLQTRTFCFLHGINPIMVTLSIC